MSTERARFPAANRSREMDFPHPQCIIAANPSLACLYPGRDLKSLPHRSSCQSHILNHENGEVLKIKCTLQYSNYTLSGTGLASCHPTTRVSNIS